MYHGMVISGYERKKLKSSIPTYNIQGPHSQSTLQALCSCFQKVSDALCSVREDKI